MTFLFTADFIYKKRQVDRMYLDSDPLTRWGSFTCPSWSAAPKYITLHTRHHGASRLSLYLGKDRA